MIHPIDSFEVTSGYYDGLLISPSIWKSGEERIICGMVLARYHSPHSSLKRRW
jgi:hypothetical protein